MSEIYWAGGRRFKRLRGTATVLGMYFNNMLFRDEMYVAGPTFAGAWLLKSLDWSLIGSSSTTAMHALDVRIGKELPGSSAEFTKFEMVFPMAYNVEAGMPGLRFTQQARGLSLDLDRAIVFEGKRLVVGMRNYALLGRDGYVAFVFEELVEVGEDEVEVGPRPRVLEELRVAAEAARGT